MLIPKVKEQIRMNNTCKTRAYDNILFDLDGTLTDPKEGITKSVQYALDKIGIHVADPDDLVNFIGPPLFESFRDFYGFDACLAQRAVEFYRERFAETGIFENRLYPGIAALLAALKDQGRGLFVATSKPTVFALRIIRHFGLETYFEGMVGSGLDGSRNSKAEVIAEVLAKYRFGAKDRTVMIGDRKHDLIGARACGIDSIGVAFGYGSLAELEECKPTYIAESIAELRRLLG
jgi:phosphoglycolate phosphatase